MSDQESKDEDPILDQPMSDASPPFSPTTPSELTSRTKALLRSRKADRQSFRQQPRRPIRLILDGVRGNYNLGAILRLCDAFLVERLVVCGAPLEPRKRKLVQAARGAQRWMAWEVRGSAAEAVREARGAGWRIVAVEQAEGSTLPEALRPDGAVCLVLGGEGKGVSPEVLALADVAVEIPIDGMLNSLNVSTAAAIVLYGLVRSLPRDPGAI